MEINLEKRKELYLSSPPEIQKLYESGGLRLKEAAYQINITNDEQYRIFALAIGDIILGMYKKESLAQLLKDRLQLSEEQIDTAVSGLSNLLSQIPETKQKKGDRPFVMPKLQTDSPMGDEEPIENQEKTEQRDETTPAVKPLRTFSDDVHHVHGYGSFRKDEDNNDTPIHRSEQETALSRRNQNDANGLGSQN